MQLPENDPGKVTFQDAFDFRPRPCRNGGRPYKMTAAKLRLARAFMGRPGTKVSDLGKELGVTRQALYRHVSPVVELRPDGAKLLSKTRKQGRATGDYENS